MRHSSSPGNQVVLEKLDGHAQSKYFQYFSEPSPQLPTRGPVEIDYWSISYRLSFRERSIFVKIPKVDRYETDITSIIRDTRALDSAQTEFNGFNEIYGIRGWPEGCSCVRPLDYVPGFNSIITEFVPSEDLFRQCRRAAINSGFALAAPSKAVQTSLTRCGAWLRHFQNALPHGDTLDVSSEQLLADIKKWADHIKGSCSRPRSLDIVLARMEGNQWSQKVGRTRTCEGFEVRNIIVDRHGTVRLVDPGQISQGSGLEDVAHFLVSLSMLFWGTSALWLGIPIAKPYRESFLHAWAPPDVSPTPSVLAWFEIRELFRQWVEAYRVLSNKPYSPTVRDVLRAVYVDTFFLNRVEQAVGVACQ